jgi:signal transduction histidine kinase
LAIWSLLQGVITASAQTGRDLVLAGIGGDSLIVLSAAVYFSLAFGLYPSLSRRGSWLTETLLFGRRSAFDALISEATPKLLVQKSLASVTEAHRQAVITLEVNRSLLIGSGPEGSWHIIDQVRWPEATAPEDAALSWVTPRDRSVRLDPEDPRFTRLLTVLPWASRLVPLVIEQRVLGVWIVGTRPQGEPLTAFEVEDIERMAKILAGGYQSACMYDDLQLAAAAAVQAQQQARFNLASRLHDVPLRKLQNLLRSQRLCPEAPDAGTLVRPTLEEVTDDIRAICDGLYPAALDGGVGMALQKAINEAEAHYDYDIVARLDDSPLLEVTPEQMASLYTIVVQALANAGQHAQADTIHVRLTCAAEGAELVVADNGVGFATQPDPLALRDGKHYGLFMMKLSVLSLGGSLAFGRGLQDRGASVIVRWPNGQRSSQLAAHA